MESPSEEITPLDLASLAAALSPEGCRVGCSRDALLHAMALFEESVRLCRKIGPMGPFERLRFLRAHGGQSAINKPSSGADHLAQIIEAQMRDVPPPVLTLAKSDSDNDTLRSYLKEHLNFEGKTRPTTWSTVRTVRENLKAWITCLVNEDNSREPRLWKDPQKFWTDFLARNATTEHGSSIAYAFPAEIIRNFIAWRRDYRKRGGLIKEIRPLPRAKKETDKRKRPKRR
jgi:hypothetical protein